MGKNIDKRVWGVLGKQQTYFSPQKQVEGKTKTPLNANAFDSWDSKRSSFKRIDGYAVGDAAQQGGVVPQVSATPVISPTPSFTPTPTITQTNTPTPTITQTNTPSITPSNTPASCIWNETIATWNNNTNNWDSCGPIPPNGTNEAQTYLRAVVDNGGTGITSTVSAATITLFTSLYANGLWDKMVAFYPMLGGNSNGCKFNGKNPVDTNAGYRLVFNGGWTFNSSGATSNGTNAYANTNLNLSALTLNDQHASVYMNLNVTGTAKSYFGAVSIPTYFVLENVGTEYYGISFTGLLTTNTASPQGLYLISTTANTMQNLYKNGALRFASGSKPVSTINLPMFIAADNRNGSPNQYNNNQYSFTTVGFGLNGSQQSTLSTIINTFQTTLSRNTY